MKKQLMVVLDAKGGIKWKHKGLNRAGKKKWYINVSAEGTRGRVCEDINVDTRRFFHELRGIILEAIDENLTLAGEFLDKGQVHVYMLK